MIQRDLENQIRARLGQGKIIVIYGARQVGKTTLLHALFDNHPRALWLNGDDDTAQAQLRTPSADFFRPLLRDYTTVIIDEAQRIENIGLKLKILHDNFGHQVQFIATGSSSFDLANKINEPLTGRKWTFWLPAFTANELVNANGLVVERSLLENRLIYGSYPDVVVSPQDAQNTITELASDNLYRDVLSLGDIIKTDKLRTLLKALALQIGSQVSLTELANLVGISHKTVDKYISLLEQSFIIFRLPSFGRNLRNELKFSQKIYFYDIGIRNAIINDFRHTDLRLDIGAIFENYIIAELKKMHINDNIYFWRNTDGQEIDFVLEKNGAITAIEIKYNPKKTARFSNTFVNAYAPAETTLINAENYLDVLVK